jgi:hypothetical protein
MVGAVSVISGQAVVAQPLDYANELPPPPAIYFGEQPLPTQATISAPTSTATTPRELDFQAPAFAASYGNPNGFGATPLGITPAASGGAPRYLVYLNGNSDLLLEQVRRIEPGAFRRDYNNDRVIQAGLFISEANAKEQIDRLSAQGILAQLDQVDGAEFVATTPAPVVVTAATVPYNPTVNPASLPNPSGAYPSGLPPVPAPTGFPNGLNSSPSPVYPTNSNFATPAGGENKAYFVAIPGTALSEIYGEVMQTGVAGSSIVQRESRRGPYVAVGPFLERSSANLVERRLREAGLKNARVYYGL